MKRGSRGMSLTSTSTIKSVYKAEFGCMTSLPICQCRYFISGFARLFEFQRDRIGTDRLAGSNAICCRTLRTTFDIDWHVVYQKDSDELVGVA